MPYLTAAVVLLGLLCLMNLTLTLGIIRRLKEKSTGHAVHPGPPVVLKPGSPVPEFTDVTVDGEPVSGENLTGLVGFFSAGCTPCHELAPRFVEYARRAGRENVLAVVGGDDDELVSALAPVARVVAETFDGPVAKAFQNTWSPALYLVGADRRIVATAGRMEDLPVETPV